MKCPFCQYTDTQVVETRDAEEGSSVRRRRQCLSCNKRFTTYEKSDVVLPTVVKNNGSREDFLPSKILFSLKIALRKRPVSTEQIEQILARIEQQLLNLKTKEVSSKYLGNLVMQELQQLDLVGYVRFASVYKSFANLNEFNKLISSMNKTND